MPSPNTVFITVKITLTLTVLTGLVFVVQTTKEEIVVPEVGNARTLIICQGNTDKIKCSNASMVLVIYSATYGRREPGRIICPYDRTAGNKIEDHDNNNNLDCELDVTKTLRKLCHKRKKCKVSVNSKSLGQPQCRAVHKYLKFIYACEPKDGNLRSRKPTSSSISRALSTTALVLQAAGNSTEWGNSSSPFTRPIALGNELSKPTTKPHTNVAAQQSTLLPRTRTKNTPTKMTTERKTASKIPPSARRATTSPAPLFAGSTQLSKQVLPVLMTVPAVRSSRKNTPRNTISSLSSSPSSSSHITDRTNRDNDSITSVTRTPVQTFTHSSSSPITKRTLTRAVYRTEEYTTTAAMSIVSLKTDSRNSSKHNKPSIASNTSPGFPVFINVTANRTMWNITVLESNATNSTPRTPVITPIRKTYTSLIPTLTTGPVHNTTANGSVKTRLTTTAGATILTPTTGAAIVTPAIMQSEEGDMGVAGLLFIWFLHLRENSSAYVAVFAISALCAALVMGAVFGRWLYLKRRTKTQKFAVLHKPKRFFKPPPDVKTGQQNGQTPLDINMNDDGADGLQPRKTSDLLVTKIDVDGGQMNKHLTIDCYGEGEDGGVPKGENSSFYVNPMYEQNRQDGGPGMTSNQTSSQRSDTHMLNNASEGCPGTFGSPIKSTASSAADKQRTRCNSVGNIARGFHHGFQRRHPSTGNISTNKDLEGFQSAGNVSVHQSIPRGSQQPQQQNLLYNAPQIQPYQGQQQYHGQRGTPSNQSVSTNSTYLQQIPPGGPHPLQTAPQQQQQVATLRASQKRPSLGLNSASCQSPTKGYQGRNRSRPPSPYEYGSTGKDVLPNHAGGSNVDGPRKSSTQRTQSLPRLNSGIPATQARTPPNPTAYEDHQSVSQYGRPEGNSGFNITANPNYTPATQSSVSQRQRQNLNNHSDQWSPGKPSSTPQGNRKVSEPGIEEGAGYIKPCYGKNGSKVSTTSVTELVSPLDNASTGRKLAGTRNSLKNNTLSVAHEVSRPQAYPSAPPDLASDSSEDDLYSIVAKGNYESVVPDPNLTQRCAMETLQSNFKRPAGGNETKPAKMFTGRDTAV